MRAKGIFTPFPPPRRYVFRAHRAASAPRLRTSAPSTKNFRQERRWAVAAHHRLRRARPVHTGMDELFLLLDLFDDLLGPLCVICLTCYVAATTGLFARHTHILPRAVDAVLAAATVVGSIGLLHQIERLTNLTLFDGKMLGSAVVFCTNPTPPPPRAFAVCTACAFLAGVSLHFLGGDDPHHALLTGLHLLFSKLSGCSFSAAVGLAAYVSGEPWDGWVTPLRYMSLRWLCGHAILYAAALVAARPRRAARVRLMRREWVRHLRGLTRAPSGGGGGGGAAAAAAAGWGTTSGLRVVFEGYDTDGDGRIDATELCVALRALTGAGALRSRPRTAARSRLLSSQPSLQPPLVFRDAAASVLVHRSASGRMRARDPKPRRRRQRHHRLRRVLRRGVGGGGGQGARQ